MRILGIDTSTNSFSVCICDDDKVLYEVKIERTFSKKTRDGGLFRAVQELFNNMENEPVAAIALSFGPGMFTSLRVGLALAKGLHISRNIPICGVNTLEVIANSFLLFDKNQEKNIIWAPVMEAFQGEVFVAFYSHRGKIGQDMVCNPQEFSNFINRSFKNKKIFAIGPGTKFLKEYNRMKSLKKNLYIIDSHIFNPSASKVVLTALPRIKKGIFNDPEFLEPYYIKKTAAELKEEK